MLRKRLPLRADIRARLRTRADIYVEPRLVAVIVAAIVVIAVAVYATLQLLRPIPTLSMTAWPTPLTALPGVPPQPAWPAGAESALGIPGIGVVATHGGNQEVPMASVTKIMTAYQVLLDHPLAKGAQGPSITVTSADAAIYASDKSQGESVAKVAAGERLTERQALEAMLIPSGNNIAALLASWDAGSQPAFVAKMNARAHALGLSHTHYADASGYNAASVSTASDQLRLAIQAMGIPAFRHIVAMPQVTLPVAGVLYNSNYGLGHDGIAGVKTGSSPQAGGCLVFSSDQTVAGQPVTIFGVVLGIEATAAQPSELTRVITVSENLITSVDAHLERVRIVRPGTVLGVVHSPWSANQAAIAETTVSVMGWPGIPVHVRVIPLPLGRTVTPGQRLGQAIVSIDGNVSRVTLYADGSVHPPSLAWRLTRP